MIDKVRESDLVFFGFLLAVLVLTAGGHIVQGDEETMFRVTQNILSGKGIAVGREEIVLLAQESSFFLPASDETIWTTSAVPGRDGLMYSKYGIGQSLAAIPLYLLGDLMDRAIPSEKTTWPDGWYARLWVSMFNPLALAGCGWLMMVFGRSLGYTTRTSRWVAAAAVFSTMLWPYVKTFYSQPGVAFLLLLSVCAAYRWRQSRHLGWLWVLSAACGVGILFRLSFVIVLLPLALYLIFSSPAQKRWAWIFPLSLGVGAAIGITAGYNWLRFESIFETGYHEIAWTTPFLLGLFGLLFSPGKGIVFYTPLIMVCAVAAVLFRRSQRAEMRLIAGLWVCYLAFYAPHNYWTGGFNWGPRFLVPLVPVTFLPLGALLENARIQGAKLIFGVFFTIGLAVQTPAILVDHSRYLYQQFSGGDVTSAYSRTIIEMTYSPVVRQWPVAMDLLVAYSHPETWQQAKFNLQEIIADAPDSPNSASLLASEFIRRNTIDCWWGQGQLNIH